MTSYDVVFKRFYNKIEDYDHSLLTNDEQMEQLTLWLDSAIGFIELDNLKITNDLSDRDNELQMFACDLENSEIEVIALYMVVAWYDVKINTAEHTSMFFGSKDEKWTNPKQHMDILMSAQERYRKRARKYFRNNSSRKNNYLGGNV